MERPRLMAWLELLAGVSVLLGLLLVVQKLRQNNTYARAESTRDLFQMWAEIYRYQTDNNIDALMSKSYSSPSEMTDEEIVRLDGFYWQVMNAEWAQDMMAEEGLVSANQDASAKLIADSYFSSRFGRAWFSLNKEECKLYARTLCEIIAQRIKETPVKENFDYLRQLRSRL